MRLRRSFGWAALGNASYALSQWAMLIVLAKAGSPAMVGDYALALAIAAPIMLLANMQLRNLQATDARDEYHFRHYLALRLSTNVVAFLLIAAWTVASGYPPVLILVGVAKGIEACSDVIFGLLHRHERMDRVAYSLLARAAFGLAGWVIGLLVYGSVPGAVAGMAIGWATTLLILDIPAARRTLASPASPLASARSYDLHVMRRLALQALPLGVVSTLISFTSNYPRYVIERVIGVDQLGIFAALAYTVVAMNMLAIALAQAASPRLACHAAAGDGAGLRRLLLQLMGVGFAIGATGIAVSVAAGRPILTLMYGPEYGANAALFTHLMVVGALTCTCTFVTAANTAVRCIKPQLWLQAGAALVTVVVANALIDTRGLHGAAFALVAGMLVKLAGSLVFQWSAHRRLHAHPGAEEQQTSEVLLHVQSRRVHATGAVA